MITQLPRWVWSGTWLLAFIAGSINVIGLMGFDHQPITHLTGTTSLLSVEIAQSNWGTALHFFGLLFFFMLGCVVSGFIIQNSTLKMGRRYGVALFLASALLFVAEPLLNKHNFYGLYIAACACGLQNAMISTYSGAVVRTTHLSGMFTDLGIFLGHALRGLPIDSKRLRLCCLVISGFFCGGLAGTWMFQQLAYSALLLPATLTALAGLVYSLYAAKHKQY